METSPFIDAHHHLWDLDHRPQPWIAEAGLTAIDRSFRLDDLRPLAAAAGVTSSVLVQCIHDVDETREFLALAASGPLVAGVVGWTDLQAPGIADDLVGLKGAPGGSSLVGIRHLTQAEPDPDWLAGPPVRRGLAALGEVGLAFDLLVTDRQLPAAVEAAKALPEVTFVLDHLASPPVAAGDLSGWARAIRPLGALPNVVAKFSGLVTSASWDSWTVDDLRPVADLALEVFGPSRLMFGSDWPVCLLAAGYAQVVSASGAIQDQLSADEQRDFRAGTAQRAYHLPVPPHRPENPVVRAPDPKDAD